MEEQTINLTELIIQTINTILSKMVSSIDNTMYDLLDHLTFITPDILSNSSLKKIIGESNTSGILLICNSLVLGLILYYAINYLISHLTYARIDSPKQFIFKSILFIAIMNASIWICEEIISLISMVNEAISGISLELFGVPTHFSHFIENLNRMIYASQTEFNFFSFDGILKSFISFGLINLTFSYALRYIMIQIFIMISPFAFLSLILNSSEWFFKIWIKTFLSLLLTQLLISLILLLSFSIESTIDTTMTKILYVGIIFALTKSNIYMKELFGGITTTVNMQLPNISKL